MASKSPSIRDYLYGTLPFRCLICTSNLLSELVARLLQRRSFKNWCFSFRRSWQKGGQQAIMSSLIFHVFINLSCRPCLSAHMPYNYFMTILWWLYCLTMLYDDGFKQSNEMPQIGLRIRIIKTALKLIACLLYVVRVVFDSGPADWWVAAPDISKTFHQTFRQTFQATKENFTQH